MTVGTTVFIGKSFPNREMVAYLEPSKTIKLICALNAAKPPLLIVTILILVKKQKTDQGKKIHLSPLGEI